MKVNIDSSLRKALAQMGTQQLDELLQAELQKDAPDKETVLTIMDILQEREKADPVELNSNICNAWADFQDSCGADQAKHSANKRSWIIRAAAIAAVVCVLIMTVPQAVGAERVFDVLARWTERVFTFFSQVGEPVEYTFQTDHPGLQEIYDVVTEAGITQPVVPTWVPEGFELTEIKTFQFRDKRKIYASMHSGKSTIVLSYTYYIKDTAAEYSKDIVPLKVYEWKGIPHHLISNDDTLTITWNTERLESFISSDCQEEVLVNVVDSIYLMEDFT